MEMMIKGYTVKSAMMEMSMVSGYYATKSAINQMRYGAKTPIIDVYEMI
jgi:glycerol-3-phosphate dehydrogenase (NAD(P)+)